MTQMELVYLVKALRAYRHVYHGQFDQETLSEVQETQDAARAIEELMQEVSVLNKDNEKLRAELKECRDLLKEIGEEGARLKEAYAKR